MTRDEMKKKREELGNEILKTIDFINGMVRQYAELIGETRPITISISSRTAEEYANALAYIDIAYFEEQGETRAEAANHPELFNVWRSSGRIGHDSVGKRGFLGEEGLQDG